MDRLVPEPRHRGRAARSSPPPTSAITPSHGRRRSRRRSSSSPSRGARAHALRVAERPAGAARPAGRGRGAAQRRIPGRSTVRRASVRRRGRRARGDRGPRGLRRDGGHASGEPKVLTASAREPDGRAVDDARRARGRAVVEDVVAAGPHGTALASAVLPLVLAGLFTGALCAFAARVRRRWAPGLLVGGLGARRGRRRRDRGAAGSTWSGVIGSPSAARAGADRARDRRARRRAARDAGRARASDSPR